MTISPNAGIGVVSSQVGNRVAVDRDNLEIVDVDVERVGVGEVLRRPLLLAPADPLVDPVVVERVAVDYRRERVEGRREHQFASPIDRCLPQILEGEQGRRQRRQFRLRSLADQGGDRVLRLAWNKSGPMAGTGSVGRAPGPGPRPVRGASRSAPNLAQWVASGRSGATVAVERQIHEGGGR